MPHQSSKKKCHYYQSATSYLVVDTGHSNTYCHAFAADSNNTLFEPFPQFCLLCRLHIHSCSHYASSAAAGEMLSSLDSFLKTQDRSDMGEVFSMGRSKVGAGFLIICNESCRTNGKKTRQFNSNRCNVSADINVDFIVLLPSTNIGIAVVVVYSD